MLWTNCSLDTLGFAHITYKVARGTWDMGLATWDTGQFCLWPLVITKMRFFHNLVCKYNSEFDQLFSQNSLKSFFLVYIKNVPYNNKCDECDPEGVPTFLYGVKQTGANKVEQIICLVHQAISLFFTTIYVRKQPSQNFLMYAFNTKQENILVFIKARVWCTKYGSLVARLPAKHRFCS